MNRPEKKNFRKNSPKPGFRKRRSSAPTKPKDVSEGIRLNKYIASTGICSRREADELISQGLITINGEPVTEMGKKVVPGDDVRYNGERLKEEKLVYIIMNKPKDFVTTVKDPHAKKTVLDIIGDSCKERIFPVGRLDKNTTGVLLLTNDGDLTKKLTHPKHKRKKIYHVFLDKSVTKADFDKILNGVTLEDGPIHADALSYTSTENKKQVGIEIHSGKNRIIRRIFEHLGYKVYKLDRVYFAGLTKKGLKRGQWRFLSPAEVSILKSGSYK